MMDRDAYKREEGAVVESEKRKTGGVFAVEILVASLERNSHQAQVQIFSPTCENKSFFLALFHMAMQGCLSLHGLTAARKAHCYIYLKACQVFALILAYLQEGMWMGSQDKNTGLFGY